MDHRISPPLQSPVLSIESLRCTHGLLCRYLSPKSGGWSVLTRFPWLVQALSCTSYARPTHRRDGHIDFFAAFNSKLLAAAFTSLLSLPIFIFRLKTILHISRKLCHSFTIGIRPIGPSTISSSRGELPKGRSPLRTWSRYGAARTAMGMTPARTEQNLLLIARHDSLKTPTNAPVYCTLRRTLQTVVMAISIPTTQLYVEQIP